MDSKDVYCMDAKQHDETNDKYWTKNQIGTFIVICMLVCFLVGFFFSNFVKNKDYLDNKEEILEKAMECYKNPISYVEEKGYVCEKYQPYQPIASNFAFN